MSHVERSPRRHPWCTCPELTWANFDRFDRSACAGGTMAHPVVSVEEFQQLLATYPTRERVSR